MWLSSQRRSTTFDAHSRHSVRSPGETDQELRAQKSEAQHRDEDSRSRPGSHGGQHCAPSATPRQGPHRAYGLLVGAHRINESCSQHHRRIRNRIRKAIGATFADIFIQILVESVVIAILGGAVGLMTSACW